MISFRLIETVPSSPSDKPFGKPPGFETAQEGGNVSVTDADTRLPGEGADLGLGDVIEPEAPCRPLLERDRLVLCEHEAQLVVVHLLGAAVEAPVVPGAAGVGFLLAFRHDDGDDATRLRDLDGDGRLAVPREVVDLGLHVIGQPLTDDVPVVADAEDDLPALGVRQGHDVLVDAGRVPRLELHGEAFASADEELDWDFLQPPTH